MTKIKNRVGRQVSLFSLIVVLLATPGCDGDGGDQHLAGLIAAQAQRGNPSTVRMSALTTFPWERLFVFAPYTTAEAIENDLGFRWSRSNMIEMSDQFSLLVFVKDKSVMRFVAKSRSGGDFVGSYRRGGFSREEAVFRCSKNSDGWLICVGGAS